MKCLFKILNFYAYIDYTDNLVNSSFWCSNECQPKNSLGNFLILNLRCEKRPCFARKQTHWDRAPFICSIDGILQEKNKSVPLLIQAPAPTYPSRQELFSIEI